MIAQVGPLLVSTCKVTHNVGPYVFNRVAAISDSVWVFVGRNRHWTLGKLHVRQTTTLGERT